ncbi:MAG TPA: DEAD/DEAH box helicase [Candidatus Aquilonibacter sp.]|nr:DEAD/DEAH box helicase [Candidatus Aquilonibacter sp.]
MRDAADGAVDSWVEAVAASTTETAKLPREHILYAIDVQENYYVPRFVLNAFAAARRVDLATLATANAKHATAADRTIGKLVSASGLLGGLRNVSPIVLGTLLEALIATNRLMWRTTEAPPLVHAPLERASLGWLRGADGRQRLHVAGRPSSILLPSAPLWYVDTRTNSAGSVGLDVPMATAAVLASAPSLTPDQARRVNVALRHVFSSAQVEPPHVDESIDVVDRDPMPVLRFEVDGERIAPRLTFAYGDAEIRELDSQREFRVGEAIWPRRMTFEAAASERLRELHLGGETTERGWVSFVGYVAPQLRREGWRVEIPDDFPYAVVEADDDWQAELTQSQASWFDVDLGIEVAGERIALLPLLVNGLNARDDSDEPVFARLPSGAYVALPRERVRRLLATLVDLFEAPLLEDGRARVPAIRAAALDDLFKVARTHGRGLARLRELFDALTVLDADALEVPASFNGTLRPYQREGVAWLQALRERQFGGVLADDMGLGKTVQLLAHAMIEREAGRLRDPMLIVAPTSVVPNWRAEIARFAPALRVLSLTGNDRRERFGAIADADVVLTTYALLPRDVAALAPQQWSIAVFDEAQAIKNPRTNAATIARRLRAQQRVALTGTPIENHLEELWSIFAVVEPSLLEDLSAFRRLFRTPIEKHGDTLRRATLASRLRPFLLRRTKASVASDLPPKTEIVQRVELSGAQRDLYETIRLAMHAKVREEVERRGLGRSRIVVLDALLKLRQVCCDPRLLKLPGAATVGESAKLEALLEMLASLIEDGRRILLFSQFTSMLDLIKPELAKRNIPFVELRGATRDRETPVKRFQNREVPLFLISLKAGGTGLNLTAADTIIHYDPWWNPAVEAQATDRAHRIGQDQHVFVYKLIADATVEDRIVELQERKGDLAATLFDETSHASLALSSDDIEALFS